MVKNCRLFVQCLRFNLMIINFVTKGYNDKLEYAIRILNYKYNNSRHKLRVIAHAQYIKITIQMKLCL